MQTKFRQEQKGDAEAGWRCNLPAPDLDEGSVHFVLQNWLWFRKEPSGLGPGAAEALKVPHGAQVAAARRIPQHSLNAGSPASGPQAPPGGGQGRRLVGCLHTAAQGLLLCLPSLTREEPPPFSGTVQDDLPSEFYSGIARTRLATNWSNFFFKLLVASGCYLLAVRRKRY